MYILNHYRKVLSFLMRFPRAYQMWGLRLVRVHPLGNLEMVLCGTVFGKVMIRGGGG